MARGEDDTLHLGAADLIPERQRCARTEDDQDTRYCRECLQKPCRWFNGWRPDPVEAEVLAACDDSPGNKTQEHFKSRRKLFEEVDRLIRGRVREVLPGVTLEFKQQIDRDLGLDALRARVQRLADGVAEDANAVGRQLEVLVTHRINELLASLQKEALHAYMKAFAKRAQTIVANEVAEQLARFLGQPRDTEHRGRAKKKKKKRSRAP